MKAPKCKVCGERHWFTICKPKSVGHSRTVFDRVAYQRNYMRKRRAKAKESKP